ncbi:MAG: carbohydrate-binding family 9-like protein [Gemmatimonadetes bacterium]|nr:carbohydrate-binding family 9-like protein [Gemmatimonadota bacterium]
MDNRYLCYKINQAIPMDGKLDHPLWQKALKTKRFIDVIDGNPSLYDTKAAMLYNNENLYIGFWCEEPFPHATITQRDGLLWFENDLEVFIDGGDSYYEFQLSALNTIYEVFYIWQDVYEKNGWDQKAPFEILSNKALTFGGNHDRTGEYFWRGSHPRGNRWAFRNWDFPGLQSFVHIDGVLTLMLQKKPLKCVFEFTPVSVRRRGNASDRFQPWDWDLELRSTLPAVG